MGPSRITAAVALTTVAGLALGGCTEQRKTVRGLGDGPVGEVNDAPANVVEFPNGYPNAAWKCEGPDKIVVFSHGNQARRGEVLVNHPDCAQPR